MKKLLLLVTSFSIFMLGLVTVDAKNINIAYDANNLATQNNIYIVGNWVFQLNKYAINGYDLGYASTKYALRTEGEAAKYVPIYTLANGNVYIVDEHGLASGIKYVGTIEEIFPGGVINATGLNETEFNDEDDFELTVIEPKIKESVQKLKTTEKGFN